MMDKRRKEEDMRPDRPQSLETHASEWRTRKPALLPYLARRTVAGLALVLGMLTVAFLLFQPTSDGFEQLWESFLHVGGRIEGWPDPVRGGR